MYKRCDDDSVTESIEYGEPSTSNRASIHQVSIHASLKSHKRSHPTSHVSRGVNWCAKNVPSNTGTPRSFRARGGADLNSSALPANIRGLHAKAAHRRNQCVVSPHYFGDDGFAGKKKVARCSLDKVTFSNQASRKHPNPKLLRQKKLGGNRSKAGRRFRRAESFQWVRALQMARLPCKCLKVPCRSVWWCWQLHVQVAGTTSRSEPATMVPHQRRGAYAVPGNHSKIQCPR